MADFTEDVSLEKEFTIHLAEHQILMGFVNDSGAAKFDEWWYEEGKDMFDKYCEELADE